MLYYQLVKNGQRVYGCGSKSLITPEIEIEIIGAQGVISFSEEVPITIQVPSNDSKKPRRVAKVYTKLVDLAPGTGCFCEKLPGGGIFGASLDWPTLPAISDNQVIAAEFDNMDLTGNALLVAPKIGELSYQEGTHLVYTSWQEFEQDYHLQLADAKDSCPDLYDQIGDNFADSFWHFR